MDSVEAVLEADRRARVQAGPRSSTGWPRRERRPRPSAARAPGAPPSACPGRPECRRPAGVDPEVTTVEAGPTRAPVSETGGPSGPAAGGGPGASAGGPSSGWPSPWCWWSACSWRSTPAALLIVIVAIIMMVMVHELGHFVTAKWSRMKVTEYFLGFGPPLWSVRRGETEYGVKAIPAGGYVKIPGMTNLEEVDPADEDRHLPPAALRTAGSSWPAPGRSCTS